MKLFRYLKPSEIECRVERIAMYKDGQGTHDGLYLLLYKDARCDMNILDECIGPFHWQRDHKELKGNIYCGIAIYDDTKIEPKWIWKWDCAAGRIVYLVIKKGNDLVFTYGSAWDDLMPRQKLMRYCMEHDISMQGVAKDYHLDTKSTDDDYEKALEGVMEGVMS